MLAYAAQGLTTDAGDGKGAQIRSFLERALRGLNGLADAYGAAVKTDGAAAAARAVDEYFYLAQFANRFLRQPLWRIFIHDVDGHGMRARPAGRDDLRRQALEQFAAARGHAHSHTLGREPLGDRAPYAHARTGDERGLSVQLQVHALLSPLLIARLYYR